MSDALKYLEDKGIIRKDADDLERLEGAQKNLESAKASLVSIMEQRIARYHDVRRYLILHSVFPVEIQKDTDWFSIMMARALSPTKEDVEWFSTIPKVPQEIMDKLSFLEPDIMGVQLDNVRVEYNSYGRNDPIDVIDLDWEKIRKEQEIVESFDAPSVYEDISTTSFAVRSESLIEDDLPF